MNPVAVLWSDIMQNELYVAIDVRPRLVSARVTSSRLTLSKRLTI